MWVWEQGSYNRGNSQYKDPETESVPTVQTNAEDNVAEGGRAGKTLVGDVVRVFLVQTA